LFRFIVSEVTQILSEIEDGDGQAAEKLLPLVYDELRKLAAARMARENTDQTLQATALVHEAYIRLVDNDKGQHWDNRAHFFAAAAEAMRRIIVESARRKRRMKHGGAGKKVVRQIDRIKIEVDPHPADVLALDEALDRLAQRHAVEASLVKLRFFCGMTIEEAAEALGVPITTANRKLAFARAWLYRELAPEGAI
jgi:RNA polymerase sigma factor (TIGR02999 family)